MSEKSRIQVHPGEILRKEFMRPANLSANALALALHVSPNRITEIVRQRRAVTGETALRLSRYFGTTPEFWVNLQAAHDLSKAKAQSWGKIKKEILPKPLRS